MSKKINLLIIGSGNIAKEHAKVIKAINNLNLYAVCSRTISKANSFAKLYQVKYTTDNFDKFLDIHKNKIDGILILVSAEQMFKVTKKIIKYGIPVFIEKPPALKFKDISILEKIAKKNKTLNMVGFNRRYYSIFKKGKKLITKNGKILSIIIEGHERYNSIKSKIKKEILDNWLYANSCHTIDLLRYFCGEIKYIKVLKKNNKLIKGEQFSSLIEFENGALGTYVSNWLSPGSWSIKIFGENQIVIFDPLEKGYSINKKFIKKEIKPNKSDLKFKVGFYEQMQSFKKLIIENKTNYPSQDLTNILKTFKIVQKFNV